MLENTALKLYLGQPRLKCRRKGDFPQIFRRFLQLNKEKQNSNCVTPAPTHILFSLILQQSLVRFDATVCFFYDCPVHSGRHLIPRQMQAFH